MVVKMNHLFGGIAGGIVFGLVAGLLMGSCVFPAGPNHRTVAGVSEAAPSGLETGAEGGEGGQPSSMRGGSSESTPAGMDPGSGVMESVFAKVGDLKRRIDANPKDRAALVDLANLYYDANKFDQAIVYYEKALMIDGNDPNVLTDMANSYWLSGKADRAKQVLQETQQKFPAHWQSAASLFFLAVTGHDAPLAKQALDRVQGLNPGFEKLPQMQKMYEDMPRGGRS